MPGEYFGTFRRFTTYTAIDCRAVIIATDTALRKVNRAKLLTVRELDTAFIRMNPGTNPGTSSPKYSTLFALISELIGARISRTSYGANYFYVCVSHIGTHTDIQQTPTPANTQTHIYTKYCLSTMRMCIDNNPKVFHWCVLGWTKNTQFLNFKLLIRILG